MKKAERQYDGAISGTLEELVSHPMPDTSEN